jgi:hypothetical protein
MTLLGAALRYAERGLAVLPIEPRGKLPLTKHAVKDATPNARTIRGWWAEWPDANVAIAAGVGLGCRWAVLDIDPRNGGDVALARLEAEHGPLPNTITARTGGGGTHRLFRFPQGVQLRGKLGDGLDLLGRGKYFIAAPSVHPSGSRYAWTSGSSTPMACAPAWLVEVARRPEVEPAPVVEVDADKHGDVVDRARKYLARVPGAISGQGGHSHTFATAVRLVKGFALDEETAFAVLSEWNATCEPPWSERDLRRKVKEAATHGDMSSGKLLERRSA